MRQGSTLPTDGRSWNLTKLTDTDSCYFRQPSPPQHQKKSGNHNFLQVETTQNVAPPPSSSAGPQYTQTFCGGGGVVVGPPTETAESFHGYETSSPELIEEEDLLPPPVIMMLPSPPAIAVRTRCYRLNLDSDLYPEASVCLGPFHYHEPPPSLTYSDSSDSLAFTTPVQVAVQTAKIFRGITVAKDGTILSQNARATLSSNGQANSTNIKRGEMSRHAIKIQKAIDLVEESILTGKNPETDEPANMVSLVILGEYDSMEQLARDGAKKLRDAAKLPDDSLLLSVNQPRGSGSATTPSQQDNLPISPRKRLLSRWRTTPAIGTAIQDTNRIDDGTTNPPAANHRTITSNSTR
jgi:hypothetical protein